MELASELRYADPMVDEHTLVLVVSQSGETADTIAALRECRARGATIIGIVNVVGSTIAKLADHTLYTWAGPEIAVATTKGYTTQLTVLYLFALCLTDAKTAVMMTANVIFWASLVMTVYSGAEYVWKNRSVFSM